MYAYVFPWQCMHMYPCLEYSYLEFKLKWLLYRLHEMKETEDPKKTEKRATRCLWIDNSAMYASTEHLQ